MDKACIIPWQSLMIRADGSIRPCCNSHRTLNSDPNFDGDHIWNTDENMNLRNSFEMRLSHAQLATLVEGHDWKRVCAVDVPSPQSAG